MHASLPRPRTCLSEPRPSGSGHLARTFVPRLWLILTVGLLLAAAPRIDPAGIRGEILITGAKVGIGIDEATALIVSGNIAKIVGRGKVHFFDASKKPSDHKSLADGALRPEGAQGAR